MIEPLLINNSTRELSKRQVDCLFHLVKGMTVKQIALTLGLSKKTVEHYMDIIKLKLNCRNRMELVTKALTMPAIKEQL